MTHNVVFKLNFTAGAEALYYKQKIYVKNEITN